MTILEYLKGLGVAVEEVSGSEALGHCPLHADSKNSFSCNLTSGLWKCFSRSCALARQLPKGGGTLAQLHSLKHFGDLSAEHIKASNEALDKLELVFEVGHVQKENRETPPVPDIIVDSAHAVLLQRQDVVAWLKEKRGIGLETIKAFKLGYNNVEERIYIPIRVGDEYKNIRKYDWQHKFDSKFLSYRAGYGRLSLFPICNLGNGDEVIIFEGEMDCILACSLGLNAVTATGGAGGWDEAFTELFRGKTVFICYDIDTAGAEGALDVAAKLCSVAKRTQIVHLPIKIPTNGDFTDYIVQHGRTREDFHELLDATRADWPVLTDDNAHGIGEARAVDLYSSSNEEHFGKRISVDVIVSGKDLAPFFAPRRVNLTCKATKRGCINCPGKHGGTPLTFEKTEKDLLNMINCPDAQQKQIFQKRAQLSSCTEFDADVIEAFNVEQLRVIPEIDYSATGAEYVARQVYVLGSNIQTNRSYTLRGIVVSNPKSQYATLLIDEAIPRQSSIDKFILNTEDKEALRVFQSDDIEGKLKEIYRDLSYNVTQIYQRDDAMLAMDLVFHSVLNWKFKGKLLKKGWTECLVIGDTRCGKSEMGQELIKHYRAGELFTGENTTFAGLIGGMQQVQKTWSISWGKVPLNDRRLVLIDEASGLSVDDIASMSGVRSSGVAEVVKIQTERTRSRTRLIWLSNARSGRRLDTYNQGVLAVRELIGKMEDIARLDLAVTVASGEVDVDGIYKNTLDVVPHVFTSDLCHKLVMWAWSRTEDQVVFDKDAEESVFDASQRLGSKYSSTIPLVENSEQRIKVARLSVALAARLFSCDSTGNRVVVHKSHVEYVCKFLESIYDKPSMAYDVYSSTAKTGDAISPALVLTLSRRFLKFKECLHLQSVLREATLFRKAEIIEQIGYGPEEANDLFQWMSKNRLIQPTTGGYVKTPAFSVLLKELVVPEGPAAVPPPIQEAF